LSPPESFPAPWAAEAFALAEALRDRGLFTGGEWAAALGREIAADGAAGDGGEAYWRAFVRALERLVEERAGAPGELGRLRRAWERAAAATPHGRPIELSRGRP